MCNFQVNCLLYDITNLLQLYIGIVIYNKILENDRKFGSNWNKKIFWMTFFFYTFVHHVICYNVKNDLVYQQDNIYINVPILCFLHAFSFSPLTYINICKQLFSNLFTFIALSKASLSTLSHKTTHSLVLDTLIFINVLWIFQIITWSRVQLIAVS